MAIKNSSFTGGYRFRRFAGQPEASLTDAGIPQRVALPLRSAQGADLVSLVKTGSAVKAGQIIARDDHSGALLRATIGGVVEELKPAPWLGGKTKVATLASDGSADWVPLPGHSAQWKAMKPEALRELINMSGAAALPAQPADLLVEATEAEAYNPDLEVLFQAWGPDAFAEGLAILARALPRSRLHLVLGRARLALLRRLGSAARALGLEPGLHTVSPKYPQADPRLLVPSVLGKTASADSLVLGVQTVFQVREAVVEGKPLIERIVALTGTGFARRPHLRVRIGTPVGKLLEGYLRPGRPARLLLDSLMGGAVLGDPAVPVGAGASVLIALPENDQGELLSFAMPGFRSDSYAVAFASNLLPTSRLSDTNLHGEHRACISCGFCEEVCPVKLLPNILHRYVQRNVIDETLVRYQIFRCIDCNLCSYVCTSKIPVSRLLLEGKEKLRKEGLEPREVQP